MSSSNDQNPQKTPTRNTQSNNWIQMQSEMPLRSPTGYGYPTPSPPPHGYYPHSSPHTPPPPPHGYYPNQPYPPQPNYYVPQPQSFHPQQTFTDLLTQNVGLDTINPSLSQLPSSQSSQSQIPSSQSSQVPTEDIGKKRKEKAKCVPWKQDECKMLAKCWIHVSEDAIVSNDQKRPDFWNRVTFEFNTRMGNDSSHCRSKDQVYSKYQKMNKDVAYFNDTFLSITKSKPSGWNEAKIIQRVNKSFNTKQKKAFAYHTVWEILRHNEKWRGMIKRRKMMTTTTSRAYLKNQELLDPSFPMVVSGSTSTMMLHHHHHHKNHNHNLNHDHVQGPWEETILKHKQEAKQKRRKYLPN